MKSWMFRVFNLRALLLVACTLLLQHAVFAQNKSNTGTDFWVGYGHHQFMEPGMGNSQEMVLYLSAEQPANVTVSLHGTSWVRNYSVPANTVIATDFIPKAGAFDCGSHLGLGRSVADNDQLHGLIASKQWQGLDRG